MLSFMTDQAVRGRIREAKTEDEALRAFNDLFQQGVYIIYGDVPWPFPQKGNIFGYSSYPGSSFFAQLARTEESARASDFFAQFARAESVAREPQRQYRSLLIGKLKLCWQECTLCLKIGIGELGTPYCVPCHDEIAQHIWTHLVAEYGIRSVPDELELAEDLKNPRNPVYRNPRNPLNLKAINLTKDLINPEFFASGHKTPKLQAAYSAARAARFEHGK